MRYKYILLTLALIITGCVNDSDMEKGLFDKVNMSEYDIKKLPYNERPYMLNYTIPFDWIGTIDQDSVPVFEWDGEPYYHPVYTSMYGIYFIEAYNRSGNRAYLELAEKIALRLVKNSTETNNQFYFPYNFDFQLADESEVMRAPWYSGMAQGRLLSLFSRLYETTSDKLYLVWADKTFKTLQHTIIDNSNWVIYVDEDLYYWIEEYPHKEPLHVLNGFIFAIYGLYDYYMVSDNPTSELALKAALTTIEQNMRKYRNNGGISFYDLKHFDTKSSYHHTHINQLNMLHSISGGYAFKEMADSLKSDFYQIEKTSINGSRDFEFIR